MKPTDNISKSFRKLHVPTSAQLDEKIYREISKAVMETENKKSAQYLPNIWRMIMERRITKLAAAAVIVIAVMIGINQFGGSFDGASKVYGMSNVRELFGAAKSIYLSGQIYFPPLEANGEVQIVDVEYWVDVESGRWRSVTPNMSSGPDGTSITVSEQICDGGEFVLDIEHTKSQASFSRQSRLQAKLRSRGLVETIMIFVCGDPAYYDLYKIVGQESIEWQDYNMWEWSIENEVGPNLRMQCWLSATTGDFAKALVWMKDGEGEWQKKFHITNLEQNKIIPDDIFAMETPSNFTLMNTRETARKRQLYKLTGSCDPYRLNIHALFPLRDGTVIACWSSRNTKSQDSQAALFDECEIGGSLPELPFEVYALKASVNGKQAEFQGYHLCYTELEGEFYEWGIYVPIEKIDSHQSRIQIYSVVYRSHCEAKSPFKLASGPDLVIENNVDFETFVVGAIKEFSNQDKVPNNITYENILILSNEIRDSID
jgi:hypothetical protein